MNDRTTLTRYPESADERRRSLDALLDEVFVATISTVVDGEPWSIPTLVVRLEDRVVIHGSTGAGLFRHLATGAPCTVTVFALDGIVVAESAFESSANYRSAVIRGCFGVVAREDRDDVLRALTDRLIPGRTEEVPPSTTKELAATLVLSLPITEDNWILKSRSGPSGRPDVDVPNTWAGVVPMTLVAGEPVVDDWVAPHVPVPPSVRALQTRATPRS